MATLKLARLPDRKPVKIAITVSADLNSALQAYAEAYRETYGESESVGELIPYMVEQFLSADREFAKVRKNGNDTRPPASNRPRSRQPKVQPQQ
ncbi:MAG: DUF2274 domain-containing protein [Alphaproteobacteria bacterium]|nr:DUF2274 domain-containing protein [Alphaproteobacteria bacterium]